MTRKHPGFHGPREAGGFRHTVRYPQGPMRGLYSSLRFAQELRQGADVMRHMRNYRKVLSDVRSNRIRPIRSNYAASGHLRGGLGQSRLGPTLAIAAAEVAHKKNNMAPVKRKQPHGGHDPVPYHHKAQGFTERYRDLGRSEVSGKKELPGVRHKKMKRGNPEGRIVRNAAVKTFGHKGKLKRKRKVQVSHKLREKIGKVIEGHKNYGCYTSLKTGAVGMLTNNAATTAYISQGIGIYGSSKIATKTGNAITSGYTRNWYTGSLRNGAFVPGQDFDWFSPTRVLDAASILFNNKFIGVDYGQSAGNFDTLFVPSTGLSTGQGQSPLRIHMHNSWVKMEFKNLSLRDMTIEIFDCVPKNKYPDNRPFDTFYLAAQKQAENTGSSGMVQDAAGNSLASSPSIDAVMGNALIYPSIFPAFKAQWTYTRKEVCLPPGVNYIHYVKGPKNLTYDFSKFFSGSTDFTTGLVKGYNVSTMVAVRTDLQYATSFPTNEVGRWHSMKELTVVDPIGVEVQEVFKLSVPDVAGFVQHTLNAGAGQNLVMKRNQWAFGNFSALQTPISGGNVVYGAPQEENPTVLVAAGDQS